MCTLSIRAHIDHIDPHAIIYDTHAAVIPFYHIYSILFYHIYAILLYTSQLWIPFIGELLMQNIQF